MSEIPITRIQVVSGTPILRGVNQEFWADTWEFSLQDGGRTLKILGTGIGDEARLQRDLELAKDIENAH